MNCKICNSMAHFFSSAKIIKKFEVSYFKCSNCGFIQTEEPYWLEEAYSDAINDSDIGLLSRNISLSKLTKVLISVLFNANAKFIDYGGGYGIFTRLMRDVGFDFYHYDQYCENIFAKAFEADIDDTGGYELATAFEVFEHLVNPLEEIEKILNFADNVLFTTELLPSNSPEPGEWWYYGLEHGQHISFYTMKSLKVVAETFKLNLYSNGKNIHLLTNKSFSPFLFSVLCCAKMVFILNYFIKKQPLIIADYEKVVKENL